METESDAPPTAVMSVIETCAKQRNVWVFRNLEEDEVVIRYGWEHQCFIRLNKSM
jgi:hypothetical protein